MPRGTFIYHDSPQKSPYFHKKEASVAPSDENSAENATLFRKVNMQQNSVPRAALEPITNVTRETTSHKISRTATTLWGKIYGSKDSLDQDFGVLGINSPLAHEDQEDVKYENLMHEDEEQDDMIAHEGQYGKSPVVQTIPDDDMPKKRRKRRSTHTRHSRKRKKSSKQDGIFRTGSASLLGRGAGSHQSLDFDYYDSNNPYYYQAQDSFANSLSDTSSSFSAYSSSQNFSSLEYTRSRIMSPQIFKSHVNVERVPQRATVDTGVSAANILIYNKQNEDGTQRGLTHTLDSLQLTTSFKHDASLVFPGATAHRSTVSSHMALWKLVLLTLCSASVSLCFAVQYVNVQLTRSYLGELLDFPTPLIHSSSSFLNHILTTHSVVNFIWVAALLFGLCSEMLYGVVDSSAALLLSYNADFVQRVLRRSMDATMMRQSGMQSSIQTKRRFSLTQILSRLTWSLMEYRRQLIFLFSSFCSFISLIAFAFADFIPVPHTAQCAIGLISFFATNFFTAMIQATVRSVFFQNARGFLVPAVIMLSVMQSLGACLSFAIEAFTFTDHFASFTSRDVMHMLYPAIASLIFLSCTVAYVLVLRNASIGVASSLSEQGMHESKSAQWLMDASLDTSGIHDVSKREHDFFTWRELQLSHKIRLFVEQYFVRHLRGMPQAMWTICLVQFFAVASIFMLFLETADLFGIHVFGGNPDAPPRSAESAKYSYGTKVGSLALFLMCSCAVLYAFIIPVLKRMISLKILLLSPFLLQGLCLIALIFVSHAAVCITLVALQGVALATVFSIPLMIVVSEASQESSENANRGLWWQAGGISSLHLSFFSLSQLYLPGVAAVFVSLIASYLLRDTLNLPFSSILICAAVSSIVASYLVFFVKMRSAKKDVTHETVEPQLDSQFQTPAKRISRVNSFLLDSPM